MDLIIFILLLLIFIFKLEISEQLKIMKIQLKQKWELNRFFEYDVSDKDIKENFKTLAAFRKALKANDETVNKFLNKRNLNLQYTHAEDDEQMIEQTLQEKK